LASVLARDGAGPSRRNWRLDWLAGEDNR
jgi:hypothetical protein